MQNLKFSTRKKSKAQAMVEFALALPILLMLLYGVLEVGRLLFIYASTVTAARQAVRYGSAAGVNTTNVPFYQDCTGIRAAAKNVGFINRFNDADIIITYDRGLDFSGAPIQISSPDPACASPFPTAIQNGDRIIVQVSTQWQPIVSLVPLKPFTITAKSERTILVSIAIGVTAPPVGWVGYGTGTLTFTASPLQTTVTAAGQVVTYNYILSNLGTLDVVGPFAIVDNIAATSCPIGMPTTLTPGQVFICTGTYTVTQADMDAGTIANTAYATSNGSPSPSVSMTVSATQSPSLGLSASVNPTVGVKNTVATFTFTITNTGNVTLSSPAVTVSGSTVTCPGGTIAPGGAMNCSFTYTVTTTDVNNKSVTKTGTATAVFNATTYSSAAASATVETAELIVTATSNPATITAAGQVINFTYTLLNNSGANLGIPYGVTSITPSSGVTITCPVTPATIASGSTVSCTGTYTVTQADMDAGSSFLHQITASAKPATGPNVTSRQVSINVAIVQSKSLSLSVTASPTVSTTAGNTVAFNYTITNTGSVTLSSLAVTNDKSSTVACAPTTIVPGATASCSSSITVSAADITNGSIILNATATGQFGGQSATSNTASATVITYNAPRVTLDISTSPLVANGANAFVTYTYTLKNTGNAILTGPYNIVDSLVTNATCSTAASSIPIGGATVCKGSYITSSTDETNGSVSNTATVTATYASGTVNSTDTNTLTVNPAAACNVQHSVLKLPPFSAFGMTIFNNNNFPVTIQQITVTWNDDPSTQAITAVNLGGSDIWMGSSTNTPSTFSTFVGNITIDPTSSTPLLIKFGTAYTPFSPTQETISIRFTNSPTCPDLESFNSGQLQ
jgi:hypothetical protein